MNHNIKALLLDLGAKKEMDTREIRAHFAVETKILPRTITHWWFHPESGLRQRHAQVILKFFNQEYKELGIERELTFEDLHSNKKEEKIIAKKFNMTRHE